MKKTTMKDIALRANVSVATVSYVLNRVGNQTIPEKTRQQILQLAEELHYIPNLAARSLANQKTGLVGVLVNTSAHTPHWKLHAQFSFIHALEQRLTNAGYHTLLYSLDVDQPSLDIIVERKLEAVFLIDVREEAFYSISKHFVEGIPLILIDSMIEDKLFKQVLFNYRAALQKVKPQDLSQVCLIMESFNNSFLTRFIQDSIPLPEEAIFTVVNLEELNTFLQEGGYKEAIVINEFIGSYVEKNGRFEQLSVLCTCNCPEILGDDVHKFIFTGDKAATAFELMDKLLHHSDYSAQKNNCYFVE
ncbi:MULTISPECIES: LacI family DNA-binding transcriptional regulator [Paenibacillus]|uniref:LacI family DNA-binding transcriptional regulator n=1 Tax=Paenibacillus TaxID=44249 RepID=UPI002DBB3CF7|nr:LacI family DNA-binding transcriptional regulator [Paenibacillus odorifer]MEC0129749.1 LacI family DNA-binding transcriptional regulator [Paenibacillus odorifer]MEC0224007.1 LacI family DNA-binding transcriptional regulator [Paenibacillus odorifer]